ncbi:MAG: hypothetical protein LBT06_18325 [Hungatella sp.]|nr:hypothetical protein [Hungatella sp.]
MYTYISMYRDFKKIKVYFEYLLFEDSRLYATEPRTEWDRYYQDNLFRKSRIRQEGAKAIEAAGICIFNSLDDKKIYRDMIYEEASKKYTLCMELAPGLYFYEFILNPHKAEEEQVHIMDKKADSNLKVPNLSCPGFRYSGVMVYPDVSQCEEESVWLKSSRAKITNVDGKFYEINLAAAGYESAQLFTKNGQRTSFELICSKNGVNYFYLKNAINPGNKEARIVLKMVSGEEIQTILRKTELVECREEWINCHEASGVFATPEWSKHAIWYNLIPDRFRYKGEDKAKEENWKKDWYSLRSGEKEYYPDIYYRKYGGNLDGIIEKLDYLEGLGVNAVCVTPVFWGSGYHKYHTIDFRHIDPDFGPDPEYDRNLLEKVRETLEPSTWVFTKADKKFLELVEKLHDRNMKIIVDGVFSHTGENFWAFQDVKKKRESSLYYDWFDITNCSDGKLEYMGFFGMNELPKLKLYHDRHEPLLDWHIYEITKRWMTPFGDGSTYFGVDGWRLDVANEMPVAFWKKWRKHVKSINPEGYILGEMMFTSYEPFLVDSFDAIINYRFGESLYDYFVKANGRLCTSQFVQNMKVNAIQYNAHSNYSMQNILDSHDTDRMSSMIKNKKQGYCYDNKVQYGYHHYDGSAPSVEDFNLLKLLVAFQVAYIGAPALYYGTECGMWGGNDPHCRKPMLWDDMGEYEPERLCYPADPNGKDVTDKPIFNYSLRDEVSYLYHLRKNEPVLCTGKIAFLDYSDEESWFSIMRYSDRNYGYLFVFNMDSKKHKIIISLEKIEAYVKKIEKMKVLKKQKEVVMDRENQSLEMEVDEKTYEIFKFKTTG